MKREIDFFLQKFRRGTNMINRLTLYLFVATLLCACNWNNSKQAQELQEAQTDSLMRHYREQGRKLREDSRFTEAIEAHKKELEFAIKKRDTIAIIQAYNNIGTNFRRMGILDEASTNHYRALEYCNRYGVRPDSVSRKNRVITLNGLGNVCLTLKDYDTADSVFRAALQGERELGSYLGQAINYANIGAIFENRQNIDSALAYYQLSMDANRKAKSNLGISLCYDHFGRIHEQRGETDKAIEMYHKAYDIMKTGTDKWHWLDACIALANIYVNHGDIKKAEPYIDEALAEAQKQNSLEPLADIYMLKYKVAKQCANCQKALQYYVKSDELRDSIDSKKNLEHLQNLRMRYANAKHKNEMSVLTNNYQTAKRLRNISLICTVLITLLAITIISFLYYTLRNRKRKHQLLMQTEHARTSFYTNVTHEFRTPLTVILGYSTMMEKCEIPSVDQAVVGKIITRQGQQLLSLINQLLDISRIKTTVGQPEWRNGDIIVFVSMLTDCFQNLASAKNVTLTYNPQMPHAKINFVPEYLQKIINNLVSNAIKFSNQGGQVEIKVDITQKHLLISVADNGCGIIEEDKQHIFDLFYQSATPQKVIGSGVGLSLVKQIVDSLRGEITVDSKKDQGTTFLVKLPLYTGKCLPLENAMETDISETATEDAEQTNSKEPIILVVEDNADVLNYMRLGLKQKYKVLTARDGEEGLNIAQEQVPDIIITDIMMPKTDGWELCRAVRHTEILAHIPVIMVTAKNAESDKLSGLHEGADAYLTKPFNAEELQAIVGNLLERQARMRQKYSQAIKTNAPAPEMQLEGNEKDFLEKVKETIITDMVSGDINVETIATHLCLSTQQFRRKLSTITGETPAAHIRQVQMSEAKRLITEHQKMSVAEIATTCGFYDASHFARVFKSTFGATPTQMRKAMKE